MPNSSARGSHAFLPMNAAPPGQLLVEDGAEVAEGGEGGVTVVKTIDIIQVHSMNVDKDGNASTLVSTFTTKWKLTTFASEGDNTISFSSSNLVGSSSNLLAASIPSTAPPSEPSRKKSSTSIATLPKKNPGPFPQKQQHHLLYPLAMVASQQWTWHSLQSSLFTKSKGL